MLAALPFGAFPDDTGEYMLGDVLVSVVLMESSGVGNGNTEDWTAEAIQATKDKVVEGVTWWEDTLQTQFPNTVHALDFQFDFTYADAPVETDVEPISLPSYEFQDWIKDFFSESGFNLSNSFSDNIRAFNHSQREAYGTDWAFTVFVVNDENDADGWFAPGGFRRAFSFPGGQFMISPAGRPASTFAHETGHMFWARDEYAGGGSYTDHRGYYDTYNLNAHDNPAPGFTQAESIMATGWLLDNAHAAFDSSTSSLEMIGWRDSDGDGIFDVLDVPFTLSGSGFYNPDTGLYHFLGASSVQPLFNLNPSGLQNDITLNKITGVEYRVDGGAWLSAETFSDYEVELDLQLAIPAEGIHTIEIRTVDAVTGLTSNVFLGDTTRPASVLQPGINGFVWQDVDEDGQYDPGEPGSAGWDVYLVDASGVPLDLIQSLDPDDYPDGQALTNVLPEVTVAMPDEYSGFPVFAGSSGGNGVFANALGTTWTTTGPELRIDFATPVTSISLDAIGPSLGARGRLEIYDAGGNLLDRYTTDELGRDDVETMSLQSGTAEIAYAIARGHAGSGVRLDRLRIGPDSSTSTDANGTFSLPNLAAGTYFVEAKSPAGELATSGRQTVTLGEGEAADQVAFSVVHTESPWQNSDDPMDVNGDGFLMPVDVLLLVNYLNNNPDGHALPPAPATPPPFYDVNGDNYVTPTDILLVINELNYASAALAEGSDDGDSSASAGGSPGESYGGEGEYSPPWSLTAASPAEPTGLNAFRRPVGRLSLSPQPQPQMRQAAVASAFQRFSAEMSQDAARSQAFSDDVQTHLDELLDDIAEDIDRAFQATGRC
jgi:hypothetical protein